MKYLFALLLLSGCASSKLSNKPTTIDIKKDDCFDFVIHDMNINLGRNWVELQVYDVVNQPNGNFILFREIETVFKKKTSHVQYKYEVIKKPKELESSGIVWMTVEDFTKMQYDNDKNSAGFGRFWYPEEGSIRNGIHCNIVESK